MTAWRTGPPWLSPSRDGLSKPPPRSVHIDLLHTVNLTSHGKLQAGSGLDLAVVVSPVDHNKTDGLYIILSLMFDILRLKY